jgi:hypothetical protein
MLSVNPTREGIIEAPDEEVSRFIIGNSTELPQISSESLTSECVFRIFGSDCTGRRALAIEDEDLESVGAVAER